MALDTIKLRWTGLRPLVMSNVRGVDPLNPLVMELSTLTKQRAKDVTPAVREQIQRLEWEISAYHNPEDGFHVPSDNLLRTIQEGGAKERIGKKVAAGAFISELVVPIADQGKYK